MSGASDDQDKQHEPTEKRLNDARKKGELARSADLNTAAAYGGFLLAGLGFGALSLAGLGQDLSAFLAHPHRLAEVLFTGAGSGPAMTGGIVWRLGLNLAPWLLLPAVLVVVSIIAQRSFVVAPDRIRPKLSRISILSNAKQKFGAAGLFEFAKSAFKLLIYAVLLALIFQTRLAEMIGAMMLPPRLSVTRPFDLSLYIMGIVVLIALAIGAVDFLWQAYEHKRRNRMSDQDLKEEVKQSEGDPQLKGRRRQRAMEIATNKMLADVPTADVIIVNPTHYAVALKWDRSRENAPVCVASGVDEIAARIREIAAQSGVPIHSDPPTARAIFATVEVGQQILPDHFRAVAAAIRFAEAMRKRAKGMA